MKSGFTIERRLPVAAREFKSVCEFTSRLKRVTRIDHAIRVLLVPADVVKTNDGGCGFAAIGLPPKRCKRLTIYVAAKPSRRLLREIGIDEWRDGLLISIAHEVAHYEQWRDGRTITERGVAVRARNLAALTKLERTVGDG